MDQVSATGVVTTLVHFAYNVDGEWRLGCMPGMTELHATMYHRHHQHTNDPRATTCPACVKSAVYKEATAKYAK